MSGKLRNYKVLLVDPDREMGGVFRNVLGNMGFSSVHFLRSGNQAVQLIHEKKFDFLVIEKELMHMNGIELAKRIRNGEAGSLVMPIIMLSGSNERDDVLMARDAGINEYMMKPFSSKTVYQRLERLIEYPREFVISHHFKGPNRRYRNTAVDGDKRTYTPTPIPMPLKPRIDLSPADPPIVWQQNFSLRAKLGRDTQLKSFVTPTVLNQAQVAIDSIADQAAQWVKNNLKELRSLYESTAIRNYPASFASDVAGLSLTISSRASMSGYKRAAEIAYALYVFSRNQFQPGLEKHRTVVKQFIDVLMVMMAQKIKGDGGALGEAASNELNSLLLKYTA